MTDLEAAITLNLLPRVGPVRVRRLIDRFGSPKDVFEAKTADLLSVEGVGEEVASNVRNWRELVKPDEELALAARNNIQVVPFESPDYPARLREIHDPPILLYVLGELSDRDRHGVAVVGSRTPSHYGMESARRMGYQLAYAGLTVVSGLALGIDTHAHEGALAARGRTVAVVGSGLMTLYPPENRTLARKIIEGGGAVVSEFPLRRKPDRQTFPMRNRIVSGWSFGVLVVEAGLSSGAMITANQAGEQGRNLYAIPGPIDRPNSQGCNRLIQQGAKLVMDCADVLDDFGLLFSPRDLEAPPQEQAPPTELSANETTVFTAIGREERAIDAIIAASGLPSHVVLSTLMQLELKRLVKQLPGRHFIRVS